MGLSLCAMIPPNFKAQRRAFPTSASVKVASVTPLVAAVNLHDRRRPQPGSRSSGFGGLVCWSIFSRSALHAHIEELPQGELRPEVE